MLFQGNHESTTGQVVTKNNSNLQQAAGSKQVLIKIPGSSMSMPPIPAVLKSLKAPGGPLLAQPAPLLQGVIQQPPGPGGMLLRVPVSSQVHGPRSILVTSYPQPGGGLGPRVILAGMPVSTISFRGWSQFPSLRQQASLLEAH